MAIEAYLFFPGTAEEAMGFYQGVFGGELEITRVGDVNPDASDEERHGVINAHLASADISFRASDRSDTTLDAQTRVELTVIGTDDTSLRRVFDRLGEGGRIRAPLEMQFWGDTFGALTDRFGIGWQVNITAR
jgi:PhnB protein